MLGFVIFIAFAIFNGFILALWLSIFHLLCIYLIELGHIGIVSDPNGKICSLPRDIQVDIDFSNTSDEPAKRLMSSSFFGE